MAAIAVRFLVGQTFAKNLGVTETAGQNLCAFVTIALGLTPVGVLFARQIALQRAEQEQARRDAAAAQAALSPAAPPAATGAAAPPSSVPAPAAATPAPSASESPSSGPGKRAS